MGWKDAKPTSRYQEAAPTKAAAEEIELSEEEKNQLKEINEQLQRGAVLDPLGTAGAFFVKHAPFGAGEKLLNASYTLSQKLAGAKEPYSELYKQNQKLQDKMMAESDKANPKAAWVGTGLGVGAGLAAGPALRGAGLVGQAASQATKAPLLARALGATKGQIGLDMAAGALGGFGADRSDTLGGTALNTALGAVGGPVFSGVAGQIAKQARLGYAGLQSVLPEARALLARGAPLTLGQMNPHSLVGMAEQLGTSVPGVGGVIKSQQQGGRTGWQEAVLNEVRPEGTPPLKRGMPSEMLEEAYGRFGDIYEPIAQAPVNTQYSGGPLKEAIRKAFERSVADPNALVSQQSRNTAGRFLENQATLLDNLPQASRTSLPTVEASRAQPLPAATEAKLAAIKKDALGTANQSGSITAQAQTTAEPIMKMRSNIRREVREGSNQEAKRLIGTAEEALTYLLQKQLGPEVAEKLAKTDNKYRQYKIVEDAVARGMDREDGFAPAHLSMAVRSAEDLGDYARGAGGALRELAIAGNRTLDTKVPVTGARVLGMPFAYSISPAVALLNASEKLKLGATGQLPWQQAMTRTEDWLRMKGLIDMLRAQTSAAGGSIVGDQ